MKNPVCFIILVGIGVACRESETVSEYTGNETTYALQQASEYVISGTATLKERRDGATTIVVQLSGTEGESKYPVHLHLGDITTPKADVAAILSPLSGKTGRSETRIDKLADETPITYQDLVSLNASMKIHLSDMGAERNIILAGGNIGIAVSNPGGRRGFAVCKSEY
jgi:hypothetical protein